jgi:hypothetical protein
VNRLCKCRPGCLATLGASDDVVDTVDGHALADHVYGAWPQEPLFDAADVAS